MLRVEPVAPLVPTGMYGDVPVIDATATRDPLTGDTTLFVVNRPAQEPVRLEVSTTALGAVDVEDASALSGRTPRRSTPHRASKRWRRARSRWRCTRGR